MNKHNQGDQLTFGAENHYAARRRAVFVACALVAGIAGVARAADPPSRPSWASAPVAERSVHVVIKDLNLASAADMQAAIARLSSAAREACEYTTKGGDYVVGQVEIYRACVAETMTAATDRLQQLRQVALTRSEYPAPGVARNAAASSTHGNPVSQ
jgi:UrcA family protein